MNGMDLHMIRIGCFWRLVVNGQEILNFLLKLQNNLLSNFNFFFKRTGGYYCRFLEWYIGMLQIHKNNIWYIKIRLPKSSGFQSLDQGGIGAPCDIQGKYVRI